MHSPTCNVNLYVLCCCLFNFGVNIVKMKDSISTRYLKIKARKLPILFFVGFYFLLELIFTHKKKSKSIVVDLARLMEARLS